MPMLGMQYDKNVWKNLNVEILKENGRRWFRNK